MKTYENAAEHSSEKKLRDLCLKRIVLVARTICYCVHRGQSNSASTVKMVMLIVLRTKYKEKPFLYYIWTMCVCAKTI